MVVLPKEFVKTRYPGYFWNTIQLQLYTIKVSGILRPLKLSHGGVFNRKVIMPGYNVSVYGVRRRMTLNYLNKLQPSLALQVIDIQG